MATAVVLSLAWFAAANAAASLLAWTLAHAISACGLALRPGWLLGVRLLPASASILFVTTLFMPAHWRFEPRDTQEAFGVMVYATAALGAWLVLRTVRRATSVAYANWRLRACRTLPRIASPDAGTTEVYEVQGLPGVSLAGVMRPRILVGPVVRQVLTAAELDAAVAHEMAHHAALDNVKRFVLFCAPDLFGYSAAARRIEEEWRAAAEWQADARAVHGDQSRALHLASALIKVARLATSSPSLPTSPAWSTLHEAPLLETRVRRLVAGDTPSEVRPRRFVLIGAAVGLVATLVATGAAYSASVHQFTERVAHLLP